MGDVTFLFFFLRCYISLGLLPFSFCPPFIPSGLTTHKVHERCSQKSHSLRVRSGLGIKNRMSTLLSLARTYEMGCTPHLLGPRPSCRTSIHRDRASPSLPDDLAGESPPPRPIGFFLQEPSPLSASESRIFSPTTTPR